MVEHWIRGVVPRGSVRYLVDEEVGWAYMGELSAVVRSTNAGRPCDSNRGGTDGPSIWRSDNAPDAIKIFVAPGIVFYTGS